MGGLGPQTSGPKVLIQKTKKVMTTTAPTAGKPPGKTLFGVN